MTPTRLVLALLVALGAAACDRPPGECLADELAKPIRTSWAKSCECDLRATPEYQACVDAWAACRTFTSTDARLIAAQGTACELSPDQGHDPDADDYLDGLAGQNCCENDRVIVGGDARATCQPSTAAACEAPIACDSAFDACLRAL